jgi:hypothetical protein
MPKKEQEMRNFLLRLLKPVLNQRGEVGDSSDANTNVDANADPNAVTLDEKGFIPGTSYKTVADLIKGHGELKSKFDAQGNEIGKVRKEYDGLKGQTETLANILKENLSKGKGEPEPVKGIDYDSQIAEVRKQLESLDPMDKDFTKNQAKLITKLTNTAQAKQHELTLKAATTSASELLKKELGDRDAKAAKEAFYNQNPTFSTPEMQARIQDFLSKDKTGMHDPMSAFFQIERDDLTVKANQIAAENAEMQKRLDLAKGTDKTGTVIVKGKSPGSGPTKPTKVTGKDLDAGMKAALSALNTG